MKTIISKCNAKKIIYYLLGICPLIIAIIIYPHLPNKIPCYYNIQGSISRWEYKNRIFVIPILILVFTLLQPKIFTEKFQNKFEERISEITAFLFIIFISFISYFQIHISFIKTSTTYNYNFFNLFNCIFCMFSIFIGIIFIHSTRNSTICINISTYLIDDITLKKAHKTVGIYLVIINTICCFISIFLKSKYIFYVLLFEIIFTITLPVVATYIYLKNKIKKNKSK